MRQSLLFLALHLLGVVVCLAIGPRRRLYLCCALGFAVGLATAIPALVLVTAAGAPYGRLTAGLVFAALAAAALLLLRRRGWPDRRELRAVGLWSVAFAVLCVPITALNVTLLTPDSHSIIALGRVLVDDGGFDLGLSHRLSNQGPFQIVAHSTALLIGKDYLYSLSPVLGLSFVAIFAITLWHGLGAIGIAPERRHWPVALVTAVLFTIYMVQLHTIYVHENLGSAIYLLIFVALFWLAEVERDTALLPVAFIALIGFSLHRVENPVAAALFLALALLPSALPRRAIAPGLIAFLLVVCGWNLFLAATLPGEAKMKLDAGKCLLMVGLLGLLFACWVAGRFRPIERLGRHAPALIAAGAGLALVAAFWRKPDQMLAAADAMRQNLGSLDDVGLTWYGIAALGLLGLLVAKPPAGHVFTHGIGLYLVLVLLLAYEHGAYVVKIHDSAMRMSLHILPLAFFYLGLKLALATRSEDRPAASGSSVPT